MKTTTTFTLLPLALCLLSWGCCSRVRGADYLVQSILPPSFVAQFDSARINNLGEVVWYERVGSSDWDVHSCLRGQITTSPFLHASPDINDSGQTVWQTNFANDGSTWDIVLDGVRLTDNGQPDTAPRINNPGEMVWESAQGIFSSTRGVLAGNPVTSPEINDLGEVVYNATDGVVSTVQGVLGSGGHPSLNNLGEVVWMTDFQAGVGHEIVSSIQGTIGVGAYPDINDLGDIVFYREITASKRVVVLWQDGIETTIDPGAFNAKPFPTINNAGVIAFAASSLTGQSTVFRATPVLANPSADFNGTGGVEGGDFLSWQRNSGLPCTALHAQGDADGNGAVDDDDLSIWRTQYGTTPPLSASAAVPEPSTCALALAALCLAMSRRRSF